MADIRTLSICVVLLVGSVVCDVDADVKKLLSAGDKLLMKGRSSYPEAIGKYTEAINLQPENIKALYRRAELYSMMKKYEEMSADLGKVLKADPGHRQGLVLRSKYLASNGNLLEAAADFSALVGIFTTLKKDKKAVEARDNAASCHELGQQWEQIRVHLDNKALSFEQKLGVSQQCVQVLEHIIAKFAKDNVRMRIQRAKCALRARNQVATSDEIKYILKRDSHNLEAVALGARAFRALGAMDQARSEVKRCLNLDPDFAACRTLHKQIKSYEKQTAIIQKAADDRRWNDVVKEADVAAEMEDDPPNLDQLMRWKCEGFKELRDVAKGIDACTKILTLDGSSIDVLLWRADLYIMEDDLDKAQEDVNKANELNNNHERVREYLGKLEKLRKIKDRKDYYKILGIKKTASDKEIRSAYRKLAMRLHPDQLRSKDMSEEEKQKMDDLFRDINEAKEALLDTEKRQRYDNGEDVSKPPEQQQQGGGFPGGFPFGGGGGGGGNFHFHFG